MEQDLRQTLENVSAQRLCSPEATNSKVELVRKLEHSMQTGQRRLANQEKAIETIAKVIESMSGTILVEREASALLREGCTEIPTSSDGGAVAQQPGSSSGQVQTRTMNNPTQSAQQQPQPQHSQMSQRQQHTPAAASWQQCPIPQQVPRFADPTITPDVMDFSNSGGAGDVYSWTDVVGGSLLPDTVHSRNRGNHFESAVVEEDQPVGAEQTPATFPSLQRNGQMPSIGGENHPTGCRPCSFFCFSKRGCKKGVQCEYCHQLHVSRSNRRSLKLEPGQGQSTRRPANAASSSNNNSNNHASAGRNSTGRHAAENTAVPRQWPQAAEPQQQQQQQQQYSQQAWPQQMQSDFSQHFGRAAKQEFLMQKISELQAELMMEDTEEHGQAPAPASWSMPPHGSGSASSSVLTATLAPVFFC